MKQIAALLLLITTLTSCSTLKRVQSIKILASASIEAKDFYAEVPYESNNNLQIFTVRIEDKPYRFIFDTGGYTVFSAELINSLTSIKEASYIDVKDGNRVTSRIKTYKLAELIIGGVTFSEVGLAKIGFTESEWFKCLGLDGTIGPNVMKECLWLFDDQQKRILLTDDQDKLPIPGTATEVAIRTDNVFKPSIDFQLDGYQQTAGFDTGFNGLISLMEAPVQHLLDKYPSVCKLGTRINAGNSTTYASTRMVKLDSISFNGLTLRQVIASVETQSSSNLLGSQIFAHYTVLIDLTGKKMYFAEIPDHPLPEISIESFGLSFDFREAKIVVGHVYDTSPAQKKGIRPGDQVLSINGKEQAYSSYCAFVENFKLPQGAELELEILKEGQPFLVRLSKQRLL